MEVRENHRLFEFEHDEVKVRFDPSPNFRRYLVPQFLMVHFTGGSSVNGAVGTFKNYVTSAHLIIGKDGKEVVQMVDFNHRAVHAHEHNQTSIGIELDYPGYLLEIKNNYRSMANFRSDEIIYGTAQNDWKLRPWPVYPRKQLDTLLDISKKLIDFYRLKKILGHEDVNSGKLDPGPAFPMSSFKSRLIGKTGLTVLEEIDAPVHLHLGPGKAYKFAFPLKLEKGTPVTVVGEAAGWMLVDVMADIDDNPWVMGWVPGEFVKAKRSVPVVHDHQLFTDQGRQYRYVEAHPNNYDSKREIKEHRYLVMHITTGTNMQSTINTFQNPGSIASAHLLIGRDGRIVQFVPFNHVAYHTGYSYWEGQSGLNHFSIGIELDNAGYVRFDEQTKTFKMRDVVIDQKEIVFARHWKYSNKMPKKPWQTFTDIQLEVAKEVARTLIKHYGLTEILGHDMISLTNRLDPGPLFPIEEWRKEFFGHAEPAFQKYVVNQAADVYENIAGIRPNTFHPLHPGKLPAGSDVQIITELGKWSLIRVLSANPGRFVNLKGWIASKFIKHNEKTNKTIINLPFYQMISFRFDVPPPTSHDIGKLNAGVEVRIQEKQATWALVAVLGEESFRCLEGWIEARFLDPVGS